MHWTGVAIALGGGADGEGARPLPGLELNSYRLPSACNPSPPAAHAFLLKAPAPEGAAGDTGDKPSPGMQTLDSIKRSILSSGESAGNWESLH